MRTLPTRWQRLSVPRQLTQSTSEEQWQAVASLPRLGTTVQIGRLYLKERALVNRTLMRWIPGCPLMGGSSSQLRPWSNVTGPMSCGRVFPRLNKPSSARNRVPCRGCPSLLFPLRPPLSLASSSPLACPPFLFSPLACPPFLFSHLAMWLTTRSSWLTTRSSWPPLCSVSEPECWAVGDFLWRASPPGCAGKQGPTTNLFVSDLDLPIAPHDARQLEVVADGLPLFGGVQLAIDTTLVSPVRNNT